MVSPSVGISLRRPCQVGPADRAFRAWTTYLVRGFVAVGASPSITIAWPSSNLESKAIRMAARTAFLGIAVAVVAVPAGEGHAATDFRLLVRFEPARALPVPFWRNSFLPEPATSARPRVLTVPTRRAALVHHAPRRGAVAC